MTCGRPGCEQGTATDPDGSGASKAEATLDFLSKQECQDASDYDLFREWKKVASCKDLKALCTHAVHGTEVSRMCRKTCHACPKAQHEGADAGGGADVGSVFVALMSVCGLGAAAFGGYAYYRRYRSGDALQGAYVNLAGGESDRDRLQ